MAAPHPAAASEAIRNVGRELGERATRVEELAQRAFEAVLAAVPELLSTAVILLIAVVAYKLISRGIHALTQRTHLESTDAATLRTLLRWLVVPLVVAAIAARWGVLENFWAAVTAAVTLVAIGFFAVWSVLSNVLCSVILLANRPFRIGDEIELVPDPVRGRVLQIALTHTTLLGAEGESFQVPNNLFFQRVVKRFPRGGPDRLAAAAALQPGGAGGQGGAPGGSGEAAKAADPPIDPSA